MQRPNSVSVSSTEIPSVCCVSVFPCWSSALVVEMDSHPLCFSPEWEPCSSGAWRILQRVGISSSHSSPAVFHPKGQGRGHRKERIPFGQAAALARIKSSLFQAPSLTLLTPDLPEVHELSLCVTIICSLPLLGVLHRGSGKKTFLVKS